MKGEKSTTQQRKPYFIKQENKNIILGTKRLKKKRNGWKRRKCKRSQGRDEMGGLFASELCRHTHHPLYPSRTLRPKANTTVIFRGISRLFFLLSVAGFTFSPGQSRRVFAGENLSFSNHRPVPQRKQKFQLLEKFSPICTHQRSQGPLVKAPNLKEKCQTFRTSYFIK